MNTSTNTNIFNIGLKPDLTLTEKRTIRFTNFSIVFGLSFCLISSIINMALLGWIESIFPLLFFFLLIAGLYAQKKHYFRFTKLFTLSIAVIGIMVSCWLFSTKSYIYYLFLLTLSIGMVLYPKKREQVILLLIHLICLVVSLVGASFIPAIMEIPSPFLFGLVTFLSVLILLFVIIRIFTSENQIFENKTNELVASLQVQKAQIEKQALALKVSNERLQEEIAQKNLIQEQLKASNEELKRFVYVASHDLKEPLRSIGSFTQLINRELKEKVDDTTQEYFNFVTGGVKRMGSLLDDLLAYSKVTRVELLEKESLDLNEIVTVIQNNLHNLIYRNDGQIILRSELPLIYGNKTQLTQVFQNLISNAIKFRGEKSPIVYIDFLEKPEEFVFSIKDNGIGVPKKQQKKIFNAFQRLNKSNYEGTGIGLAICEKVVTNHQGKIWLESEEGNGATFYFSIAKEKETLEPKLSNLVLEEANH